MSRRWVDLLCNAVIVVSWLFIWYLVFSTTEMAAEVELDSIESTQTHWVVRYWKYANVCNIVS